MKGAASRKKHAAAKRRGLALGDSVACCAAEALAASLRLAGHPVSDDDVLALYWLTADDPDSGASIQETLEAAGRLGLAGIRLAGAARRSEFETDCPAALGAPWDPAASRPSLILGVNLPGPHAVLATPDGWHSWGDIFCPAATFPDAVIEEAWAVTWPQTGRG